ncbi:MAG: DegT/DnrJ/EryC1/StrS family aminotransferase [Caldilineaceae bacterium]
MTATSAHTAHNPAEIGGAFEDRFLPYGRQSIDEDDIQAVVDVLRSDWLTTGPKVAEFEHAFAASPAPPRPWPFQTAPQRSMPPSMPQGSALATR